MRLRAASALVALFVAVACGAPRRDGPPERVVVGLSGTDTGTVTCDRAGDAIVRVSVHGVAADAFVRCRPVHHLALMRLVQSTVGDSAQHLPLRALDADHRPVTLLDGKAPKPLTDCAGTNPFWPAWEIADPSVPYGHGRLERLAVLLGG